MYYHVQVITSQNKEIYCFDISDLSFVENEIVAQHLSRRDYQLNGFFIAPSEVSRIVITESNQDSMECVNISYSRMEFSDTKQIVPKECMFDNDKFSRDITQEVFDRVEKRLVEGITQDAPSIVELDAKIKTCLKQLDELESSFSSLKNISKNMLDEKAAKKYRVHNYILVAAIFLYYGAIITSIIIVGWDTMEPVTYVLSFSGFIAGLIYLFTREKTFNINIYLKSKKDKTYDKVYENYGFLKATDTSKQKAPVKK